VLLVLLVELLGVVLVDKPASRREALFLFLVAVLPEVGHHPESRRPVAVAAATLELAEEPPDALVFHAAFEDELVRRLLMLEAFVHYALLAFQMSAWPPLQLVAEALLPAPGRQLLQQLVRSGVFLRQPAGDVHPASARIGLCGLSVSGGERRAAAGQLTGRPSRRRRVSAEAVLEGLEQAAHGLTSAVSLKRPFCLVVGRLSSDSRDEPALAQGIPTR
jgi:hypothetical protein